MVARVVIVIFVLQKFQATRFVVIFPILKFQHYRVMTTIKMVNIKTVNIMTTNIMKTNIKKMNIKKMIIMITNIIITDIRKRLELIKSLSLLKKIIFCPSNVKFQLITKNETPYQGYILYISTRCYC